jgi:hypothetical protein
MCVELFRFGADVRIDASSGQAREVLSKAHSIRREAEQSGLNCYWDYYFVPGGALDETWQEPWGGCDAGDPAKFLVAPAYVVDKRIFQRQRVFTAPAEDATDAS